MNPGACERARRIIQRSNAGDRIDEIKKRGGIRPSAPIDRLARAVIIGDGDRKIGGKVRGVIRRTRFEEEILQGGRTAFLTIARIKDRRADQFAAAENDRRCVKRRRGRWRREGCPTRTGIRDGVTDFLAGAAAAQSKTECSGESPGWARRGDRLRELNGVGAAVRRTGSGRAEIAGQADAAAIDTGDQLWPDKEIGARGIGIQRLQRQDVVACEQRADPRGKDRKSVV